MNKRVNLIIGSGVLGAYFSTSKKFSRKRENKFLIGSNKNSLYLKNKYNFKFNIFGKKLIKKMYKSL